MDFRIKQKFADATININYENTITKFYFSRMKLCAHEYFARLFSFNEDIADVTIHDIVAPNIFNIILEYIWFNIFTFTDDTVIDIIQASDFFLLESLREACCHYLFTESCKIKIITRVQMIREYGNEEQLDKLFRYLAGNKRHNLAIQSPWCIEISLDPDIIKMSIEDIGYIFGNCQNAMWYTIRTALNLAENPIYPLDKIDHAWKYKPIKK